MTSSARKPRPRYGHDRHRRSMVQFGTGVGLRFTVSSAQDLPPEIQTAQPLPIPATARWHLQFSQVATSGGRVVTALDLQGVADISEDAVGIGPKVMTDGLDRKFWRFGGAEFLNIALGLICDTRDVSVFMVARVPRGSNIAGSPALIPTIEAYRDLLRAPQFLTDTLSGSGQAFEGKLSIISSDLIRHNGKTRFEDAADAVSPGCYAGDSTHHSVLVALVRVTGVGYTAIWCGSWDVREPSCLSCLDQAGESHQTGQP